MRCCRVGDRLALAEAFGCLIPITHRHSSTCGVCHFKCLLEAEGFGVQRDLFAVVKMKRREAAYPVLARDIAEVIVAIDENDLSAFSLISLPPLRSGLRRAQL
jgi:hypothetical protein